MQLAKARAAELFLLDVSLTSWVNDQRSPFFHAFHLLGVHQVMIASFPREFERNVKWGRALFWQFPSSGEKFKIPELISLPIFSPSSSSSSVLVIFPPFSSSCYMCSPHWILWYCEQKNDTSPYNSSFLIKPQGRWKYIARSNILQRTCPIKERKL